MASERLVNSSYGFVISLNVWPDVVPLRVLLKGMPQSAQRRLRKVLSHELDAEGQAQASKLFLEAELLSPL